MENLLRQFNLLTAGEIDELMQYTGAKMLRKGDYFIREGEVCHHIAFVKSGMIRSFYVKDDGRENTYCFIFPNHFLGAYSSIITGQPTHENMQAVTDTELILVPKEHIFAKAEKHLSWARLMKTIAEQQYLELEQRVFQLQSESARERYLHLLQHQPEYILNIPLQHLASYLGITQRHLSRLRNELSF